MQRWAGSCSGWRALSLSLPLLLLRPLLRVVGRGLPGGNSLFFCFAKRKVSKRKGDPGVCVPPLRYGQPAVLGSGGVSLNSPSAQTTRSLIRLNLRSSAHTQGDPNTKQPKTKTEYLKQKGHAWRVLFVFVLVLVFRIRTSPSWLGRGAQRQADQGSRCLSVVKRSEFSETPLGSSTAGCPVAKRRGPRLRVAFSLVTFFWRSKRKLLAAGQPPASKTQQKKPEVAKEGGREGGRRAGRSKTRLTPPSLLSSPARSRSRPITKPSRFSTPENSHPETPPTARFRKSAP